MAAFIEALFLAPKHRAPQVAREDLNLVAQMGIVGDRNFGESRWNGQNLTLIEAEVLEEMAQRWQAPLDLDASRRNVVTRGIRLNPLVGKRFTIGDVLLEGKELCEPCKILAGLWSHTGASTNEILREMRGKGGLRCEIVRGGTLRLRQEICAP